MAGTKVKRAAKVNAYSNYKAQNSFAKNKAAKRARHLKLHPADEQAVGVDNGTFTRSASNKKGGWVTGADFGKMMSFLSIDATKTDFSVPKSRVVQMKVAQYMRLVRTVRNEMKYTKKQLTTPAERLAKEKAKVAKARQG